MEKNFLVCLISILSFFGANLHAQTSEKLSGNVIGACDFQSSQSKSMAFDGNLGTWYKSCKESGGWVGLDLGAKYIITKVDFGFHSNGGNFGALGIFEGANNPDFGDAIPIYIIKEKPEDTKLISADVACTRGFRYVRYIGSTNSYSRIAELGFHGYNDTGNDTKLVQITVLPTVSIHTVNAQDITSKEVYLKGVISVISEDGKSVLKDSVEIRGRGNASWNFEKKPYRIKLYKKANVLGMPAKEKTWTLISNYSDKTLMRNLLAFDFSKRLEMPYTPAGKPVDLVLNGEYKGTYQLCDQVQVKPNRVDVTEMTADDITGENLTGGYHIEIDAYADQEPAHTWFTSSQYGMPVTIKSPDDDVLVLAQKNYIWQHFNKMTTAVQGNQYKDPVNGFRKYIDTETFVRHFLVGEFTGNTDTYWSVHMYKQRNDDKFYFGPVWDFDIAYENDLRTYRINQNSNWIYASTGSVAGGARDFINRILSDPELMAQIKSVYAKYRDNGTLSEAALLKVVDDYAQEMDASQKLNFTRWNVLNSQIHMNPATYGSYAGEVNNVRNYIKGRIAWMDNKLSYIPNPKTSVERETIFPINIWSADGILHLNSIDAIKIDVIDATGKTHYSKEIQGLHFISLPKGLYVIRANNSLTQKHIVQ